MKNKKLFLDIILGTAVCFICIVLISLLFQKWNVFDYNTESFESILLGGIFSSIVFFIFMYFYSKKGLKKNRENKH